MSWFNSADQSIKLFIRYLRVFGCLAYIYLKIRRRGLEKPGRIKKMALRAVKGHLVGYKGLRGHIFKIWLPEQNIVIRARDVRFFDEEELTDKEEIQHLVTFKEEGPEKEEQMEQPRYTMGTVTEIDPVAQDSDSQQGKVTEIDPVAQDSDS